MASAPIEFETVMHCNEPAVVLRWSPAGPTSVCRKLNTARARLIGRVNAGDILLNARSPHCRPDVCRIICRDSNQLPVSTFAARPATPGAARHSRGLGHRHGGGRWGR